MDLFKAFGIHKQKGDEVDAGHWAHPDTGIQQWHHERMTNAGIDGLPKHPEYYNKLRQKLEGDLKSANVNQLMAMGPLGHEIGDRMENAPASKYWNHDLGNDFSNRRRAWHNFNYDSRDEYEKHHDNVGSQGEIPTPHISSERMHPKIMEQMYPHQFNPTSMSHAGSNPAEVNYIMDREMEDKHGRQYEAATRKGDLTPYRKSKLNKPFDSGIPTIMFNQRRETREALSRQHPRGPISDPLPGPTSPRISAEEQWEGVEALDGTPPSQRPPGDAPQRLRDLFRERDERDQEPE